MYNSPLARFQPLLSLTRLTSQELDLLETLFRERLGQHPREETSVTHADEVQYRAGSDMQQCLECKQIALSPEANPKPPPGPLEDLDNLEQAFEAWNKTS